MRDLFVIQNVSPFYPSSQPDSPYLTKSMEKFKGINCTICFKRVIDPGKMTVEEGSVYMHFGNTNPKALKCFEQFVSGTKTIHTEKNGIARDFIFLDTEKIIKNAVVEISYTKKVENGKNHLVPTAEAKFVRHMKTTKIKKIEDKVTTLF